ncbi:pilus assembly protein CpaC [Trinickia symbiotica]|uniref:Secretin n=1 Tax=Trinickia symbiotica TaxID=863227 RepID=A0A2N7XAK0_9BURK|nr:type II and III secretion system protein family protein [Trinickia symbiotica]PMS38664.1 secretin [Trinickia symbiotica]PPK46679.1 pilus assembly protein CpaC [Trinickia symbiotica]
MNTKLKHLQHRAPRRRKMSRAISAALLGASLAAAQPGIAQEMMEGAALLHPAKAARPMPMKTAMAPIPAAAAGATAAAAAAAAQPLRGPNCRGDISAETNVVVPVGKSTLVQLSEPARNRSLGNPVVAMATLVSPRTLYVVGMSVGTTNMIVQGASGACEMLEVVVGVDANGLQQSLTQLMPEERGIRVSSAAGNLVLGGRVSSAPAAVQAMEIARAYANAQPTQQSQSNSTSGGGASTTQQMSSTSAPAGVINMMTVDAPQQVMLEVKVAEVAKTLVDQIGSSLNLQGGFGSWTGALVSSLLSGANTIVAATKANRLPFQVAVDAQKTDELTKILAEPNLVTVSGQEASFLAGGRVFIPVPQSNTNGVLTIALQEEEFGVGLKFTPTVLANGRINLKVAPEVSELSPTGVAVSATGVSSTTILPLITTRRASTTVQMNDGESFAIGGLISSNITGNLKALPGLGELPIIGTLMRSTNFQQDKTELVFIVTPHLVRPLPNSHYPLPTDSFTQPNEADVYATGNMEGRGAAHRRDQRVAEKAPTNSSTLPPAAETDSRATPALPAPSTSPAPTPRAPNAVDDSAISPRDPAQTSEVPASTISSRELPPLPKGTRTDLAKAPDSSSDAQGTRAARIEAAAARIAADFEKGAITVSSTSSRPAKQ